ncbi:SipW-dependent-type signal peptide-containing protein [Aquimarina sp. ERC-38]
MLLTALWLIAGTSYSYFSSSKNTGNYQILSLILILSYNF